MIQRIQTIFWLLGMMSVGSLFFLPYVSIDTAGGESFDMFLKGVENARGNELLINAWPVLVLGIVIFLIHLFSIFQYKRRMLQMRSTMYNIILLAGWLVMGYVYADSAADSLAGNLQPEFISVMPVVAIILNLLAWRGVRRDYLMLKAVERIR